MFWFENNGARINMKSFFWRSLILKYFSGKSGRIRAKFRRTTKNLPAPTPMTGRPGEYQVKLLSSVCKQINKDSKLCTALIWPQLSTALIVLHYYLQHCKSASHCQTTIGTLQLLPWRNFSRSWFAHRATPSGTTKWNRFAAYRWDGVLSRIKNSFTNLSEYYRLSNTGVPNLSLTMYPFSISTNKHAPLQHVDRWKCTPKISYDKIYYHDHSYTYLTISI